MGGAFIITKPKFESEDNQMSNRKTLGEKLEAAKVEKQQAEARIKKLLQEQKAEERKVRNHRFCKRGGFMEKLLPGLALLTDEQFETFFKNTTANNYGRKALAELVPAVTGTADQSGGNADPKSTETAKTTQSADTSENGKPINHSNGNNHSKPAQAARVAG